MHSAVLDNSSTEYVTTEDGNLIIRVKRAPMEWTNWIPELKSYGHFHKNYSSGMVQSWNKFCFTGGVLEMAVQLPGKQSNGEGLWPAAWLMGNLGRATFRESTRGVWPWSYDSCGGIDDINSKQKINACLGQRDARRNEMKPHQGRGAPEIDIFEAMPGRLVPIVKEKDRAHPNFPEEPFEYKLAGPSIATSYHVAPGIHANRPKNGVSLAESPNATWYKDLRIGKRGCLETGFYGANTFVPKRHGGVANYMADSISCDAPIDAATYTEPHVYRVEWQPGPDGYIDWFLDNEFLFGIDAKSLKDTTGALIPEEPSYMIFNVAISHMWGMSEPCDMTRCSSCFVCFDCANPECQCSLPEGMRNCANLPTAMKIDYVRLYQDSSDNLHSLGCSPPSHPTRAYIAAHPERYADWTAEVPPFYYDYLGAGPMPVVLMASAIVAIIVLCYKLLVRCGDASRSTKLAVAIDAPSTVGNKNSETREVVNENTRLLA
jgi:beta-glucanase (GH16 family)